MVIILYFFQLIVLSFYSWALIDPNITLFNSPLWSRFLESALQLGYYNRSLSALIYIEILIGLFIFNLYLTKNYKNFNPYKIGLMIGVIFVFSYPFFSHDLFNYIFDAKILTVYGKWPWLYRPLDFPHDPWLRFMHWVHRSYPYGPVFLPLTFIPSFLAMGKFALNFFLFKLMFSFFYSLSVYFLNRINKKWAIFYATHPLVIIEGLVNNHNDIIAISFGIIGVYYLIKKRKQIKARFFLLLSAGIKYFTLPLVLINNPKSDKFHLNKIITMMLILILMLYTIIHEIQPWYWLNIFILIPYFYKYFQKIILFFFGLLLSYYPYIRYGEWNAQINKELKHQIFFAFTIINILILLVYSVFIKKSDKKVIK